MFEVNIVVYNLREESAQLVRLSLGKHDNTMYVNMYEAHFSYIKDLKSYSHSYMCSKCENSLWNSHSRLMKHELTSEAGLRHVYNGGVYHTTPSIFQRLGDEGITVPEALRFYPFRATFDFECFFDGVSTSRERQSPVDSSSRAIKCESGLQCSRVRDSALLRHGMCLGQIGGRHDGRSRCHQRRSV